ncbi:MAG: transposase [Euzebyaceae bacterium]|nr:transposase [Euzebyaceae bacterium]
MVAKTLRRKLLIIPGRLTRTARRQTLHLPTGWPWAEQFLTALRQLRGLPKLC